MFKGQITDDVLNLLKQHQKSFRPGKHDKSSAASSLSINGYAKKFCRKRFNHRYMEQITEQLDNGKQIKEVDVKLQFTRLKPLHAEWLVGLFNHLTINQGKKS